MAMGRRAQTFVAKESSPSNSNMGNNGSLRNLQKSHLGGVIFGCTRNTMKECLSKQLFGLPGSHFQYVKNIDPGLPLFLFNYSDKKLHGIFEAACSGELNINPYGWTPDGSERTQFPAQVQVRTRLRCQPLLDYQYKPIINDNYYSHNHFWFELDHAQAGKLMSLFSTVAVAANTPAVPQITENRKNLFQGLPSYFVIGQGEAGKASTSEIDIPTRPNIEWGSNVTPPDGENNLLESHSAQQVLSVNEDLMYMKLKELHLNSEPLDSPLLDSPEEEVFEEAQMILDEENEKSSDFSSGSQSIVSKLVHGFKEIKAFKREQLQKTAYLEQKLVESEAEIKLLKDRCMKLESLSLPSVPYIEAKSTESAENSYVDHDECVYLLGGHDGESCLASLDAYSPSSDVIKSLAPMSIVRSHAATVKLNGEIYIFGGVNGSSWYDTVESYNPANNLWTECPSLNERKGGLGGATLNDKIFAVGGGNGVESLSGVEMLDLDLGRWIFTQSMLQKRFSLAAVEFNGVLYASGGYDGKDYLKSAERFDPREHSWTKIGSMKTKRGCHSMVVLNDKLYAIGGHDGNSMVPSIEIYDPHMDLWRLSEPMHRSRGYAVAVVFKDHIYMIGGMEHDEDSILDVVERYNDSVGWELTSLRAVGKRCFLSAA